MKGEKIDRRLAASMTDGRIVTVVRDAFELMLTDGFVLDASSDWIVLHRLADGAHLDDVVMVRRKDVSRVWFRDDDAYHHRAITGLGVEVASYDGAGRETTKDLLEAPTANGTIVALHMEGLVGEPLVVGRILKMRTKSLDFHYVGRDGRWAKDTERWRYRDITRIELGGRYLDALNRFADPYPTPA